MNGKPYDPMKSAKEEYYDSLRNEELNKAMDFFKNQMAFIVDPYDKVEADIYSEQLDLKYTISGLTFEDLIKIIRADKHIEVEYIEVIK